MSKADVSTTPIRSRRAVLAGIVSAAAALPIAAAVPTAAMAPNAGAAGPAVVDPVIEENLKPLLGDREFLAKMIEELLSGFNRLGGHEHRIEILLPEASRAELETWFLQKFHNKLSRPLDIRFTDKISFGFKIGVAGAGSHINFSDGLVQVFSEFCSPRFRKHFFSRKES